MMRRLKNMTMIFSFSIIVAPVAVVIGRSKLANSGQTEVSKTNGTMGKDLINWRFRTDGDSRSETTSISGLESEERRYGQGADFQIVKRNINTCGFITVRTPVNPTPRGMRCKFPQLCVANGSSVEKLTLLNGQREVTSALGCRCIDPRQTCYRETKLRVFHWGTKYQKAVDVGRCVGPCNKGKKTCQAINSKDVNVKGPNGAHCMKKIVKCGCVENCYRASFRQIFTISIFHELTKTNKTLQEVIDVGHCVGECLTTNKVRCIHWINNLLWRPGSTQAPKVCMLTSESGKPGGKCLPKSFEAQVLFATGGSSKTVNVIKQCKCY